MMKRFALLLIAVGLLGGCASPQQQAQLQQGHAQDNITNIGYAIDPNTGICYSGFSASTGGTLVPCTQKVLQQIGLSPAGQTAIQQTQQNGVQPVNWVNQ